MKQEAIFLKQWKDKVFSVLEMQYGDTKKLDKKKIMEYLNEKIKKSIKNEKLSIYNNYTNQIIKTDALSVIDFIKKSRCIIGANGCLFARHEDKENPLIPFILFLKSSRKKFKGKMLEFPRGSDEYITFYIKQNRVKVIMNSIYGCLGYSGNVLYNLFIAEAITAMGKTITGVASVTVEYFLADNFNFSTEEELMEYLNNIYNEYEVNFKDKPMNISHFHRDISNIESLLMNRYMKKCMFKHDDKIFNSLKIIFKNAPIELQLLYYYKNNLRAFLDLDFMKERIRTVVSDLNDDDIWHPYRHRMTDEIWEFIKIFVVYDYPIFDRIRKFTYLDKHIAIYSDTDSIFVGLDRYVKFITNDIGASRSNSQDTEHVAGALVLYMLNKAIAMAEKQMYRNNNVDDEYGKYVIMKNEFFFKRILFTPVKKRYTSLMWVQEGKLVDPDKRMEIKGFDFKKAGVKAFINKFYSDIIEQDILTPKTIDVVGIYRKILQLKYDIEESMLRGESTYFKQVTVKKESDYKNPYSIGQFTGTLLWNLLNPEYPIEWNTDIDIVPIKTFKYEKPKKKNEPTNGAILMVEPFDIETCKNINIKTFYDKYPNECQKIIDNFYNNGNEKVRHMSLNYIAKPKNANIPIPVWFNDIIDTDKVTLGILSLFYSIMESIGLKVMKSAGSKQHLTNIIEI